MKPTQTQYNQFINLISHLVLHQPKAVVGLLQGFGIAFTVRPKPSDLSSALISQLQKGTPKFLTQLQQLIEEHIRTQGGAMIALEYTAHDGYMESDTDDAFWGAIAKGAIGLVGSLVGGKKRKRAARRAAAQQAAAAKQDVQMRMQQMRAAQQQRAKEAQRRQAEQRRRQEAEERRRREKEEKEEKERQRKAEERQRKEEKELKAKAQQQKMYMLFGGVAVVGVLGYVLMNKPTVARAA